VAISITDTGIGIDNNTLAAITKPFTTTKPPAEGAGLGLFIASWIIDKHGGELQIDTKKGEGTTVTVVLPRQH
jgi:signal transduction histidine kinase